MLAATLRRMARRPALDFSDYLELRRFRDAGDDHPQLRDALQHLEARLPVPFADALPHLITLEQQAPPPRGLSPEAVRAVFEMREEFARHGAARRALMGFDLPEGDGLKDWLDFVENERRQAMSVRTSLRELDRRIWAVYTGERKMPTAPGFGK